MARLNVMAGEHSEWSELPTSSPGRALSISISRSSRAAKLKVMIYIDVVLTYGSESFRVGPAWNLLSRAIKNRVLFRIMTTRKQYLR